MSVSKERAIKNNPAKVLLIINKLKEENSELKTNLSIAEKDRDAYLQDAEIATRKNREQQATINTLCDALDEASNVLLDLELGYDGIHSTGWAKYDDLAAKHRTR